MLFKSRFHEGIRTGRITTTVRIWKRSHVKVGGRYGLGDGAIVVDAIHEVRLEDITPTIARGSGFTSVVDLLKTAKHGDGERRSGSGGASLVLEIPELHGVEPVIRARGSAPCP